MEHHDEEARGNLKVIGQEFDDEGFERAVDDEKCSRNSEEGEAEEQNVVGSNIDAEAAAKGSSEEREDSSDSEEKVFLDENTEETKMSVSSNDSEDRETNLNWGDLQT